RVVSVEIDPGFYNLAAHETRKLINVRLLHGDVLAGKNRINPLVVAAVRDALRETNADHFHLAANLPYDVSASVIGNLLLDRSLPLADLTVTIQQEMGQRIVSPPGSRDYGPLSVLVQMYCQAEWVRTLPASAFWPRPQVTSAILHIVVDREKRDAVPGLVEFYAFVRALFMHRRKMLRAAVAAIPGYKKLKPKLADLLTEAGLKAEDRAEELTPAQLFALYTVIRREAGDAPPEITDDEEPAGDDDAEPATDEPAGD
ncbi:MAG: ribosomal RNA small subunit methyltransferase A, partial [Planctomycetia bacterium]